MLRSQFSHTGFKYHAICLMVTGVFCLLCLLSSALTPKIGFDVGVQTAGAGTDVVVKRIYNGNDDVQVGDIIEAVNGKSVQTKAALYHQLIRADENVEFTIRRTGSRYQRPVSAQEFAHGAIPVGVNVNDKPVLIEAGDGTYTPLENVDLSSLRTILENQGGIASVVFKRQQDEVITIAMPVTHAFNTTIAASLILLLIALMGVVAWRDQWKPRSGHPTWANLTIGMGTIGIMSLGLWPVIVNIPVLLLFGLVGVSLFKVVDLDYHLVYFRRPQKTDLIVRVALYIGPVITLVLPILLCVLEIPVLWGADVDAEVERKLESFVFLPMLWPAIYTLIDGGIIFSRRKKQNKIEIEPYEIAVALSCAIAPFVFVLFMTDMTGAKWFIMGLILIQALGNAMPALGPQRDDSAVLKLDSPVFSASPIRDALNEADDIVGPSWLVQVVIDRPSPKHVVGLMKSSDPEVLNGIELNVLSPTWRDFLEVFRTEGGVINGEQQNDNRNPVYGIAEKLGIVIAMPIADNVAGTLTSLTLLVSSLKDPSEEGVPSLSLSQKQREDLRNVIENLAACAPAMVYLSAEMSLDVVGEDLDDYAAVVHETASFPLSLRNPTLPLAARELPHGLIDEEELDQETEPQPAPVNPNSPEKSDSDKDDRKPSGCDTRVYEEEVSFLKSQVQALFSQQLREFALADIEFTQAQKMVLEDIETIDPPILFAGEQGTGKKLLAHAAHQARCDGPFLSIDAAVVPESIFVLDIFGDGETPGLIQNAACGSLLIENIDRLPQEIIKDVMDAIERQPIKERVSLYLAMNIKPDDIPIAKYRLDSSVLPVSIAKLASLCDAELIVLDPLRDQQDLDVIAEFYRQKEATRLNKAIDAFTPEALLALKSYAWPGNFAELHAVIERAVMKCEGTKITVSDLGKDFEELADASTKNIAVTGSDVFREQVQLMQAINETLQDKIERLTERNKALEAQNQGASADNAGHADDEMLEGTFAEIEKRLLQRLLDKYQNDPERAAEALGLNRSRFFNKLSKYQLINWS